MQLDFVRGHMGGNLIILLDGAQLPPGRELELAVKILGPNYLAGHEAGVLYRGENGADLSVKIAEPTAPSFISACGGLTQVLGKALIDTDFGERFNIKAEEPVSSFVLETGAGHAFITVDVRRGKAGRVVTDMGAFVHECYERGVGPVMLRGIPAVRAGKFLVLNADAVRQRHPGADFEVWDNLARTILSELQQEFIEQTGEPEYNYALYDWNPRQRGHVQVIFPHWLPGDFMEPSCGTGSVAVGIALIESGELLSHLNSFSGSPCLKLEAGGGIELGGPDITELFLQIDGGGVCGASFTHSLVEITATGRVWVGDSDAVQDMEF